MIKFNNKFFKDIKQLKKLDAEPMEQSGKLQIKNTKLFML